MLIFSHFKVYWPGPKLLDAMRERYLELFDDIGVDALGSVPQEILLVTHIRQVLHIRLQLLEQHQAQGHKSLRLHLAQVLCLFDRVDVV